MIESIDTESGDTTVKYGYPVSKHITSPVKADIVYILMKPLEWAFLIFLYLVDLHPEERIGRQYKRG